MHDARCVASTAMLEFSMKRIQLTLLLLLAAALFGSIAESAAFEVAAKQYPLKLEFVASTKPPTKYLTDVQVSIKDKRNRQVLRAVSDGPFMLVKLPPGDYEVLATYSGATEQRAVRVGKTDRQRVVFQWRTVPTLEHTKTERPLNVNDELMALHARAAGKVFSLPDAR